MDLVFLAKVAGAARVEQLEQLAYLLDALGDHGNELLKDENFDLSNLAQKASAAEVGQFGQIAHLLDVLGNRRDDLLKKLDLVELSQKASAAEVGQFDQLAQLLNALGDHQDKLITNENFNSAKLAQKASTAEIEQFDQLADLLDALGHRREELIKKLDLSELSEKASATEVGQFEQLAHLLNALGDYRDKLTEELNFEKLANVTNTAKIGELEGVAKLLKELGQRKSQLSVLLNHDMFVQKANQAGPHDITGLTMLMAELEEEGRNKFIQEVNWSSMCLKCPIYVHLLSPLGASLENLWKQAEMLSDKTGVDKIAQYLQAHADKIKQQIEEASTNPRLYSGVAKFFWNCNQVDPQLATNIATETISKLIDNFRVRPSEYRGAGRLINSFYAINPELSASFIQNNRVRGKIQQSINEDDWSEEVEGLKHLIEAFYRSAPDLWRAMVNSNWIVVDLSSLELDSIYRDVDEEK